MECLAPCGTSRIRASLAGPGLMLVLEAHVLSVRYIVVVSWPTGWPAGCLSTETVKRQMAHPVYNTPTATTTVCSALIKNPITFPLCCATYAAASSGSSNNGRGPGLHTRNSSKNEMRKGPGPEQSSPATRWATSKEGLNSTKNAPRPGHTDQDLRAGVCLRFDKGSPKRGQARWVLFPSHSQDGDPRVPTPQDDPPVLWTLCPNTHTSLQAPSQEDAIFHSLMVRWESRTRCQLCKPPADHYPFLFLPGLADPQGDP